MRMIPDDVAESIRACIAGVEVVYVETDTTAPAEPATATIRATGD